MPGQVADILHNPDDRRRNFVLHTEAELGNCGRLDRSAARLVMPDGEER